MGASQPLSPAPGPSKIPRYLAWSWTLISCVMGTAPSSASLAAWKSCGLKRGTTTVFAKLSLRLEK
eukprot:10390929-Alexandrium_andersonii.AAC.1